jgi:hypothetical protein
MVVMAISMCLFRQESLSEAVAWISLQAKFCKSGAERLGILVIGESHDFRLFHEYIDEMIRKHRWAASQPGPCPPSGSGVRQAMVVTTPTPTTRPGQPAGANR